MSIVFGNICLVFAVLISGKLLHSVYTYKVPHGGDGGADGYSIWVLLLNVALLCCLVLAAINIATVDGFDWISTHKLVQYLIVGVGLLSACYTLTVSAMTLKTKNSGSVFFQVFSKSMLLIIPVVSIGSGFILVNSFLRTAIPLPVYQWPLSALIGIGLLTVLATIYDWLTKDNAAEARRYENADAIKANRLKEIEDLDVEQDMLRILEFTGAVYPIEVREKAGEKIKSYPDWQQEFIRLLGTEYAILVFNFLAFNEYMDTQLFAGPINAGIISVANEIRYRIQGTSPSGFYPESFSDEVAAVLRSVEKMENLGIDFLPAVQQLREAFDERTASKKTKLNCIPVLDKWIKSRQ